MDAKQTLINRQEKIRAIAYSIDLFIPRFYRRGF